MGIGKRFQPRDQVSERVVLPSEVQPVERAGGSPRWSGLHAAALYWTDGLRRHDAVLRLAQAEAGEGSLEGFFEKLLEAGLVVDLSSLQGYES
jgi:hypothetical protein